MSNGRFSYTSPSEIVVDEYYNRYDELEVGQSAAIVFKGFKLYPIGSEIPLVYNNETKYIVRINSVYMTRKVHSTTVTFTIISKHQK